MWFARGGYGSNRIAEAALANLPDAARSKVYMGYSDAGFLLAGLHKAGVEVAWGPMPQDIAARRRRGGRSPRAGLARARATPSALEPELQPPAMAFNLTVLSNLLGTPLEPDFTGVDLLIEDVERASLSDRPHDVPRDRRANVRRAAPAEARPGRRYPPNDPDFGRDEVSIVEDWCGRSGIAFGGRADIGHDAAKQGRSVRERKSLIFSL